MCKKIEIIWGYSPKNALEKVYTFNADEFRLEINKGNAIMIFDDPNLDFEKIDRKKIKEKYKPYVISALRALGVITDKNISFHNNGFAIIQYNSDGSKNAHYIEELVISAPSSVSLEIVHKDSDGNVIFDSNEKRIKDRNEFVDKILNNCVNDRTLQQLLVSYSNALNDPDNEFFYLYEIRDGLSRAFNTHKEAISKLNIDEKKEWRKLGDIANNKPYKESRHRGKLIEKHGILHSAPDSVKKEARNIAKKMIIKYIDYLKSDQ